MLAKYTYILGICAIISTFGVQTACASDSSLESEDSSFEIKELSLNLFGSQNNDNGGSEEIISPHVNFELAFTPQWAKGETVYTDWGYRVTQFQAETKGAFYWDNDLNLEPLTINASGLLNFTFQQGMSPTYYSIWAGINGKIETDQAGENTNITGELSAQLLNNNKFICKKNALRISVPYLGANYSYVEPTNAEAREQIDSETDSFWRLNAFIRWHFAFPGSITSVLEYQYFKEFDQDAQWEKLGYDEYDQLSIKIQYQLDRKFWLNDIYLKYTTGRLLDYKKDDDRIIMGFNFWGPSI